MKYASLWNDILSHIEQFVDSDDIKKWLRPLEIVNIDKNIVTISAPNKFYKDWVEDKYVTYIEDALKENYINGNVSLVVKNLQIQQKQPLPPLPQVIEIQKEEQDKINFGMPLDKLMTFDTFVAGSSNNFAYSTCKSISNNISNPLHNPLYIYGDVGLGKTHLMQAVGNELKERYPKLNILYTTAETFTNDYITSLQKNKQKEFEMFCNSADILLFDDVQMLAGKQRTIETFFTNFNFLQAKQKRIIITSNVPPNELPTMDKRLTSRFSSAAMVDIQPPTVEERVAIILKRFEMLGNRVSSNIAKYLAENIKTNSTREIIGVITTLHIKSEYEKTEITIDYINKTIKKFLTNRDKVLSPEEILEVVANFFTLKPVDFKANTRSTSIAYPRSIAMYILREKSNLSLTEIGAYFNRNHSTVVSSLKKTSENIKYDEELKGTIELILNKLKLETT